MNRMESFREHDCHEVVDVTSIMGSSAGEKESLLKKPDGAIKSFDDVLEGPGFGLFHILLILVAGWALASDSVEVQCVSFVTPQLNDTTANPDTKLQATDLQKGLLDAVIFLGMMVGGYFWGSWSDVVGRRSCLITSLTFNGVFGFASSLSPNYYVFLFFRFLSGVGVGGSMPVAFSYFCEFFSTKTRGPFVIVLAGFWILGSVFAALLALAIIEPLKESVRVHVGLIHITAWRVYIMLCTLPALSAAFFLVFLPESPSFLFSKGKLRKTVNALERIRKINSLSVYCYPAKRHGPLTIGDLESIVDAKEKNGTILEKISEVIGATLKLFSLAYLRPTVVLCIIWFTFSFGYYGLFLWFPEYFKHIQEQELNETSSGNTSIGIYVDSVYTALAAIPATILGILTANILGGKIMLTSSIVLCAISAFLIRVVPARERNIVILSSLFNGIATFGWNALDIISTSEIFPVHLRSTAFGIQAVFGRVGAILGNIAFGRLVSVDPMIPIAIVAALLFFGGICAIFLPSPPGESVLHNLRNVHRKCRACVCWPFRRIVHIQSR